MRVCSAGLLSALGIVTGCERPVAAQATQVRIAPRYVTLLPSQNVQFAAIGLTSAGDTVKVLGLIWSADKGNVSSSGLYSAPMTGEDQVCVRVGPGGISDCAPVSVVPGQGQVSWPGIETVQASTTVRVMPDVAASAVEWTASGGNITPSGLYTAPASPGEYQVCAQAPGFLRCERIFVPPQAPAADTSKALPAKPVASVTLSPSTASATVGGTLQLVATMKDSRGFALVGRSVTWATSNVAVASVAGGGLVTGVAPGITTITATSEGMSGTSSVAVEGAPRVAIPTGPTRSRMNAADSVRGQLLSAAVAVALPVEVRQDSDVVVRLLIDPTGSAKVLGDSLASERAAGMHVEPGTTLYGSRMTARLAATGAEVPVPTSPVLLVQSRGLTTWTWVLHPKNPGPQRLWITLRRGWSH